MANSLDLGKELHSRTVRSTYLITYSRANLEKFPTRESFSDSVVNSFHQESAGKARVDHWVCSAEKHADGATHYHMAVKLSQQKRWKSAKIFLMKKHGVSVHFSSKHDDYYSAYTYVTKEDRQVLESDPHPNLKDARSLKKKSLYEGPSA